MDTARDLYQESQMYVYENIMLGRLNHVLATALYAIAKNQLHIRLRKTNSVGHDEPIVAGHLIVLTGSEELDEEKQIAADRVATAIRQMLEPCKSLLRLFYYDNLSFEVIAQRLGYQNKDVALNQKRRCLDKLRDNTQM